MGKICPAPVSYTHLGWLSKNCTAVSVFKVHCFNFSLSFSTHDGIQVALDKLVLPAGYLSKPAAAQVQGDTVAVDCPCLGEHLIGRAGGIHLELGPLSPACLLYTSPAQWRAVLGRESM